MSKKRKRISRSAEERAAWEARTNERVKQLRDRAALIRAEITAGMTPDEVAAWDERHSDIGRAVQYYAELDAERRKSA